MIEQLAVLKASVPVLAPIAYQTRSSNESATAVNRSRRSRARQRSARWTSVAKEGERSGIGAFLLRNRRRHRRSTEAIA